MGRSDDSPTRHALALVGGGGHALVVAAAAMRLPDWRVHGFFDDDPHATLARKTDLPHLGPLAAACHAAPSLRLILALGDLALRRRLIDRLAPLPVATVIDPAACGTEAPSVRVGQGVFIGARAVLQPWVRVGDHAIINTAAVVEHECEIGENVHVAPGAVLGGRVIVGPDTLIGLGACILPNVRIGTRCLVGAGAVVTADVPDGTTVAGVPARAH